MKLKKLLTFLLILGLIIPSLTWSVKPIRPQSSEEVKEAEQRTKGVIEQIREEGVIQTTIDLYKRARDWFWKKSRKKIEEIKIEYKKEKKEMKKSIKELLNSIWKKIEPETDYSF